MKKIKEVKIGKFRIKMFEKNKSPTGKGFLPEPDDKKYRIVVQHSWKSFKGEWVNQPIWCSPSELRDLANAIDEFKELDGSDTLEGQMGLPEYNLMIRRLKRQMNEVSGDVQ